MKYTVYKTTNNINGKYYIGQHRTLDPYDNYLGSGDLLLRAIKKYGRESFSKEVLFIFDNFDEMNQKEQELVTEEVVKDSKCYNRAKGGLGKLTPEIRRKNYFKMAAKMEALYGSNWKQQMVDKRKQREPTALEKQYRDRCVQPVRCAQTNKEFSSISAAATYFNCTIPNIIRKIKNGRIIKINETVQ